VTEGQAVGGKGYAGGLIGLWSARRTRTYRYELAYMRSSKLGTSALPA
jgi:hypothetical protein